MTAQERDSIVQQLKLKHTNQKIKSSSSFRSINKKLKASSKSLKAISSKKFIVRNPAHGVRIGKIQ
jgi:hypothetical protein